MSEMVPDSEKLRLNALKEFQILDTLPEQEFDDITLLASQICETPIAAVSLIDDDRNGLNGVGLEQPKRRETVPFVIMRFRATNCLSFRMPLKMFVFLRIRWSRATLKIRFYAGAPLTTSDGYKLGTLCVIDQKPRKLSDSQERALNALARSVMSLIEARGLKNAALPSSDEDITNIFSEKEKSTSKNASFFNRYVKHYLTATLIIIIVSLIKLFLGSVSGRFAVSVICLRDAFSFLAGRVRSRFICNPNRPFTG